MATAPDNDSKARDNLRKQLKSIERLTIQCVGLLFASIVAYSVAACGAISGVGGAPFLFTMALFGAAAVCGLILGGALGFIFGIPKLLRITGTVGRAEAPIAADEGARAIARTPRTFVGNTNLEEISDWLTKIIVGLSLVESDKALSGRKTVVEAFTASVKTPGAGAMCAFTLISACLAGFLFFYLETRTRVTLLLVDADAAADPGRATTAEAARVAIGAPLGSSKLLAAPGGESGGSSPARVDGELLALPFTALRDPDDFAAWGAAQVRAGKMQAGLRALREAVARAPSQAAYLVLLGDALMKTPGDAQGAVNAYEDARGIAGNEASILRKEMMASLYVTPPAGFRRAQHLRDLLASDGKAADDAAVALWTAAAYGQEYDWLTRNAGSGEAKAEAKSAALAAVRNVVRLRPEASATERVLLREILDPAAEGSSAYNNDLESFKADPDFRGLIVGAGAGDAPAPRQER